MSETSTSPTIQGRQGQAFPTLNEVELARVQRFGTLQRIPAGTPVYETGKLPAGIYVLLSGAIRITARDGHGHDTLVTEHGLGQFTGELGALSDRRSLVDGLAVTDVDAVVLGPPQLRALLVSEAVLGEKMMRAFILRRVGLIETGFGGPILVGSPQMPVVMRLQAFLSRNGIPHLLLDPAKDVDAKAFVERYAQVVGSCRWPCAPTARCCATRVTTIWQSASECSMPRPPLNVMTSRSSVPVRRDWRPRCMPLPRVSRCWSSTRAPSVAKRGRALESKTTSGFPLASRGRRSRGARLPKPRSSARG